MALRHGAIPSNLSLDAGEAVRLNAEGTDFEAYTPIIDIPYIGMPYIGMFKDTRDNNLYKTIKLGTQTWMIDNLRYLPSVDTNATFASKGTAGDPAYGVYGYDGSDVAAAKLLANYETYGVLYNWHAVNEASIAPTGWHVPTDDEWKTLEMYIGMTQAQADATDWRGTNEGTKLKVAGSSGMEIKLAGYRAPDGSFSNQGSTTHLWSSSVSGSDAWLRHLYSGNSTVLREANSQSYGFSVRCVKD